MLLVDKNTTAPDRPEAPSRLASLPSLAVADESDAITPVAPMEQLPAGRPRPYLIAIAGQRTGELFPVPHSIIIGRGDEATLRIPDEQVSRRHAEIRVVDGLTLQVRDLRSMNGTYVRGIPVQEQLLHNGDRIEIGDGNILRVSWLDPVEEQFQRQLADAALRDVLTHAFNRRYLRQRLCTELAFAQRHGMPIALLVIDVDHFKQVNDQFGHLTGDAVLQQLADTLLSELRNEDVLARWGGEEFAVLARSTADLPALVLGERIRHKVAVTRFEHGQPLHVSIGVAVYRHGAQERALARRGIRPGYSHDQDGASLADVLMGCADEALYCAKQRGRNRVVASTEFD